MDWGWYYTLDNVANGDITKWEYILNMNCIEFLNYITYKSLKAKWEESTRIGRG